jgi:1,2-diacylglycerol 3-alpha-glucosyltransferase
MITNTYLPFIGGVERSVKIFTEEYRRVGHKVIIVAPSFEDMPEEEIDVIRVPALQNFNGTDFSVQLPIPGVLRNAIKDFHPDIVHSHHPFLMGDSALRIAAQFKVPIVFTFHTFYERYTHYVPGDSPALKRFVIALATGYANLCDHVFAPSNSVADVLVKRGVNTPVDVVPTGIELNEFAVGDGLRFRKEMGISSKAFVIGFVSRIAPEKNVEYLGEVVCRFLLKNDKACFLMIGKGPSEDSIRDIFRKNNLSNRFFHPGVLVSRPLIDAYHAMDVFVFASRTETQGLVVTEALAAGIPVVAVDGPGIGEIVVDYTNGRLLKNYEKESFFDALLWVYNLSNQKKRQLKETARLSVLSYSKDICAAKALDIYMSLLTRNYMIRDHLDSPWEKTKRLIKAEFELLRNMKRATDAAINDNE